jgi:hypothetical protein
MATATFVRRVNPDSTTDLICEKCYQTIAKKPSGNASFIVEEQNHACEEFARAQFLKQESWA